MFLFKDGMTMFYKIRDLGLFCLFIATLTIYLFCSKAIAKPSSELIVLSTSSFALPLTEVVRAYTKENDVTITVVINSRQELKDYIIEGDSADVVIAESSQWMEHLKREGVIDVYSLADIARNSLSIVASASSNLSFPGDNYQAQLLYLLNRRIIVTADESKTSLGEYINDFLTNYDNKHNTTLLTLVNRRALKVGGSDQALYLIEKGATAGIVYTTDALHNNELRTLSIIDPNYYNPIIYQAAVVAGDHMEQARHFIEFLTSNKAKSMYYKQGFSKLDLNGLMP